MPNEAQAGTGDAPAEDVLLPGDERIKAAAAHLGMLMGAPVVLPLTLWIGERKKPDRSAYYLSQLKQAALFQAVIVAVAVALLIGFFFALLAFRNTLAWTLVGGGVVRFVGSNVYALVGAAMCRNRKSFGYPLIARIVR